MSAQALITEQFIIISLTPPSSTSNTNSCYAYLNTVPFAPRLPLLSPASSRAPLVCVKTVASTLLCEANPVFPSLRCTRSFPLCSSWPVSGQLTFTPFTSFAFSASSGRSLVRVRLDRFLRARHGGVTTRSARSPAPRARSALIK